MICGGAPLLTWHFFVLQKKGGHPPSAPPFIFTPAFFVALVEISGQSSSLCIC